VLLEALGGGLLYGYYIFLGQFVGGLNQGGVWSTVGSLLVQVGRTVSDIGHVGERSP
jgi:hypothetical protein